MPPKSNFRFGFQSLEFKSKIDTVTVWSPDSNSNHALSHLHYLERSQNGDIFVFYIMVACLDEICSLRLQPLPWY